MNLNMRTRPVSVTLPNEMIVRLDAEVDRLRRAHRGQVVCRSALLRHLINEALPPAPEPQSAPRKQRRA